MAHVNGLFEIEGLGEPQGDAVTCVGHGHALGAIARQVEKQLLRTVRHGDRIEAVGIGQRRTRTFVRTDRHACQRSAVLVGYLSLDDGSLLCGKQPAGCEQANAEYCDKLDYLSHDR